MTTGQQMPFMNPTVSHISTGPVTDFSAILAMLQSQ